MSRNLTPDEAAARLEDARWMAETGECLSGAARRLGLTYKGLERWLFDRDRQTLNALASRQPRDHNNSTPRGAVAWTPRSIASRKQKRGGRSVQASRRAA